MHISLEDMGLMIHLYVTVEVYVWNCFLVYYYIKGIKLLFLRA